MKKFVSAYFSFTRKERRGVSVLLLLILLFSLIPFFYPYFIKHRQPDRAAFEKAVASLKLRVDSGHNSFSRKYEGYERDNDYRLPQQEGDNSVVKGTLFYFDPNSLSADGWKKLGLRDKTIATILHYLEKGGKFRQPEDIGKIWGLHPDEVERLMPYVKIAETPKTEDGTVRSFSNRGFTKKPDHQLSAFDINSADTSAFIALPGIGSKLAARIVAFREKLGGFYKVEQVAETYGLPDSTFKKISSYLLLTHPAIRQININKATEAELKLHPYIRYNLAAAIVQYRNQHGNFGTVSDIKKIMMVTDDIYNRLSPYLSVQ